MIDLDDDGVAQDIDNCPLIPNADQQDTDGDGAVYADATPNGDSDDTTALMWLVDNCPSLATPSRLILMKMGWAMPVTMISNTAR